MNELFQTVQDHSPHVGPFMMAASAVAPKLDRNRVIETVIGAVVSGGLIAAAGYLFAMPVLEAKLRSVELQLNEVKAEVKEVKVKVEVVSERQQRSEGRAEGERRPSRMDRQ